MRSCDQGSDHRRARATDWVPRLSASRPGDREGVLDLESIPKRAPSEKEIAERLGVALELHEVINQICSVQVLQLDEILSVGSDRGEQVSLLDTLADRSVDPTTGLEGQETRGSLAAVAINSSSPERGEDRRHALTTSRG